MVPNFVHFYHCEDVARGYNEVRIYLAFYHLIIYDWFTGFVSHLMRTHLMNKSKSLQDLNLVDSFLFSATTENPQDAELIAKLIIERATGRRIKEISVMPEKQLSGVDVMHHGIRMDLCIMEYEDDNVAGVYDIEPNRYKTKELPKRSRYSQAMTDVKLLGTGKEYLELPEYVSIWILTEDPFGLNRMLYTVRSKVEEASDVRFEDGITKLFLYAYGEVGGTEELRSLLRYFVNSDSANATDEELGEIHKIVTSIKENAERRNRYMTLKEMIRFEKEESYDEGIEQGLERGMVIYISSLREFNIQEEQIMDNVIQKFSVSKEKAMELMAKSNC